MLKKLTHPIVMVLLYLGVIGSATHSGVPPATATAQAPVVRKCSEQVELVDPIEAEVALSLHYIDAACDIAENHAIITENNVKVRVIFAGGNIVRTICTSALDGAPALACSVHLQGKHAIFVPYGEPGSLRHEMLHVLMMELEIPQEYHHPIMAALNVYEVDK